MGITELFWWVPFNSAEKGFPMCYYERANMLCKCWILWRGANVRSRNGGPGSSFVIQHFLRSMQQHIIFKLHPLAMWISLSSPRCFANIYVFGQATNSICAQLNPHKNSVFDRRLFFSFPSSEKCQTRLFSLWVGNVPFRWRTMMWQTPYPGVLFLSHRRTLELQKWRDHGTEAASDVSISLSMSQTSYLN